ncbi:MAG: hypothetical protein QOJ29_5408 [Thermoleophilaceae bacterium]|nr:hypothetical protein [Thermoleophilaceae bacterium]
MSALHRMAAQIRQTQLLLFVRSGSRYAGRGGRTQARSADRPMLGGGRRYWVDDTRRADARQWPSCPRLRQAPAGRRGCAVAHAPGGLSSNGIRALLVHSRAVSPRAARAAPPPSGRATSTECGRLCRPLGGGADRPAGVPDRPREQPEQKRRVGECDHQHIGVRAQRQ